MIDRNPRQLARTRLRWRVGLWLHDHKLHWLCRVVVRAYKSPEKMDFGREYVVGRDGEKIDVTPQNGRVVSWTVRYRIVHGPL